MHSLRHVPIRRVPRHRVSRSAAWLAMLSCAGLLAAGCVDLPRRAPTRDGVDRGRFDRELSGRVLRTDSEAGRHLVTAREQLSDGSTVSALASIWRAHSTVEAGDTELRRAIDTTWGDIRMVAGEPTRAKLKYERALALGDPSSTLRTDLDVRLWLAVRNAGDDAAAALLRRRLSNVPASTIARIERELSAPRKTLARVPRRLLPADPRAIQADILPRSAWGATPIGTNKSPMDPVRKITVHHSACCSGPHSKAAALSNVKSIQRSHQLSNGWADIGYHFIVDQAGRVWEGRSLRWQGAHAGDSQKNRANVGICLLGHFDREAVPAAQSAALVTLINNLRGHFDVPLHQVFTLREIKGSTACPGHSLQSFVEGYRRSRGASFALQ